MTESHSLNGLVPLCIVECIVDGFLPFHGFRYISKISIAPVMNQGRYCSIFESLLPWGYFVNEFVSLLYYIYYLSRFVRTAPIPFQAVSGTIRFSHLRCVCLFGPNDLYTTLFYLVFQLVVYTFVFEVCIHMVPMLECSIPTASTKTTKTTCAKHDVAGLMIISIYHLVETNDANPSTSFIMCASSMDGIYSYSDMYGCSSGAQPTRWESSIIGKFGSSQPVSTVLTTFFDHYLLGWCYRCIQTCNYVSVILPSDGFCNCICIRNQSMPPSPALS